MRNKLLSLLGLLLVLSSCKEPSFDEEVFVYGNNFDTGDYTGINGVYVSEFNGSMVMGNFNNSGFSLSLNDLPEHDFIRVTFDLYIHDSWEGNTNHLGTDEPDHDAWILEFEPDEKVKPGEKVYFETTFSNGLCIPGWCFKQSYPNEFPFSNDARAGTHKLSITNGRCLWSSSRIGTTIYSFDRVFPHSRASTVIAFYDRLKQPDAYSPVCDESWSLDNLGVSIFTKD